MPQAGFELLENLEHCGRQRIGLNGLIISPIGAPPPQRPKYSQPPRQRATPAAISACTARNLGLAAKEARLAVRTLPKLKSP